MPQYPLAATLVPSPALRTALNKTADAVIKTGKGVVKSANIIVGGNAPGALYDTTTVGAAAAANKIADLPNEAGPVPLDFPFTNGLVLVIGGGQTVALSYE